MSAKDLPLIGWREWIALPGLEVPAIKAKVDTGARSSALHAFDLETFRRRGKEWVRFEIHPIQRSERAARAVEALVIDHRKVRSSGGHEQVRPVILTEIELLGERWPIELTLTRRDVMGFRMLLGRQAVRGRFLVHPGRSWYNGKPPKTLRLGRG